jgi:hypothetical protein
MTGISRLSIEVHMKSYLALSLVVCGSLLTAQEVESNLASPELQQTPVSLPVLQSVVVNVDAAPEAKQSQTKIVTPVVQQTKTVQTTTFTSNPDAQKTKIRLLPVTRTPEAETSTVTLALPEHSAMVSANPVWLQVRVEGYPLGAASQFDREKEVAVSDLGQTVHVVIDNMPYFAINDPALDPFNEAGWYYETNYKFEVPANLDNGEHTVRLFLARSYGESLKGDRTFSVSKFHIGEKGASKVNIQKPFLTYNEPSNQLYLEEGTPVLLDFFISNCELSHLGYVVRLTVDRRATRNLTEWRPYYIYGLSEGQHTVRLELLDPNGNLVPGPFNDVEQTITVNKAK